MSGGGQTLVKKIAIGLVVGLSLLAAGFYFFFSDLDSLVKSAIERYGSQATQAQVSLDTVAISLTQGEGGLSGLMVGNPKGFATPHALLLGSIKVTLDSSSIRGDGPIIIREIDIEAPEVTYELNNSGTSNLEIIRENATSYADGAGKDQQKAAAGGTPRKLVIENLYVRDGQVSISQTLLGGHELTVPMPTLHLTDIGKQDGGGSPAQGIQFLLGAITTNASAVGANELAKQLGGNALKGLFQ